MFVILPYWKQYRMAAIGKLLLRVGQKKKLDLRYTVRTRYGTTELVQYATY